MASRTECRMESSTRLTEPDIKVMGGGCQYTGLTD